MYNCKYCGKPVERSIEGELVCERCWHVGEMTRDEAELEEEIRRLRQTDQEVGFDEVWPFSDTADPTYQDTLT